MKSPILRTGLLCMGVVLAAGCGSSGDGNGLFDGRGPGGGVQSRTVTQVINQQRSQNTNETAAPIELNDLAIDDGDATETALPNAL